MREDAAGEVMLELALDEAGEPEAVIAALSGLGEESLEMVADRRVENGPLGRAAIVGLP